MALPPASAETTPPRLRVCCPLGFDLSILVGPFNLPARLGNVVEAGRIGHHRYRRRSVFDEVNGLIYTCHGGLLDLGHLRTAADLAGWLYVHLRRARVRGDRLRLTGPDGPFELDIDRNTPPEALRRIAAQVAFRLTVWHELATFYGHRTVATFPEGFSAFSPEDLVSDAWGARVGYHAILSPEPWDLAVERLVTRLLTELKSRPLEDTRRALRAFSERWWDPTRAVPEPELLRARRFDVSLPIAPLRTDAVEACRGHAPRAAVLPSSDATGTTLERWYTLRMVDDKNVLPAFETTKTATAIANRRPTVTARSLEALAAAARDRAQPNPPNTATPPRSYAAAQQGIRVLPIRLFGGVTVQGTTRPAVGISLDGGRAETFGGDITVVHFSTLLGPPGRGLVTYVTGLRADALFFCRERDTGRTYPPIAAWFQTCARGSLLGIGGRLLTVQIDGRTGRLVVQPLEAHLALDLLQTTFSDDYFRHRLVLEWGSSVETAKSRGEDADLSVRGRATMVGLIRSEDQRFELSARALIHQDVTEAPDRGVEARLRMLVRTPRPPRHSDEPAWGQFELGAEIAFVHWTRPRSSLADDALPLGADSHPTAWHAVLFVGFAAGGLTF